MGMPDKLVKIKKQYTKKNRKMLRIIFKTLVFL